MYTDRDLLNPHDSTNKADRDRQMCHCPSRFASKDGTWVASTRITQWHPQVSSYSLLLCLFIPKLLPHVGVWPPVWGSTDIWRNLGHGNQLMDFGFPSDAFRPSVTISCPLLSWTHTYPSVKHIPTMWSSNGWPVVIARMVPKNQNVFSTETFNISIQKKPMISQPFSC